MRKQKAESRKQNVGICLLIIVCYLVLGAWSVPAGAMGGPAPQKPAATTPGMAEKILLVDNFESNSLKYPREWWTFDLETIRPADNASYKGGDETVAAEVGSYSLLLTGPAKNWYGGGCGTYLAKERQDLTKYGMLSLDIFGNGPGSGTLKIELVDDDNNNWQVEQDPSKNYALINDDKVVYEVRVDWNGWKRVIIPIADFVDDNPLVGDDIWNPQQTVGSGGLLQMQFICLGGSDKGKINYNIDNVMFVAQ